MRPQHTPFPIVLSSPSGAGKTSITRGVAARDPGIFYSVSATTRPQRAGEKPGRDYHFWTPAQFAARQKAGQLLESAQVYGHWYGTPQAPILAALRIGRDVIADLDVQGAQALKKLIPGTVRVFVTAPDRDELQRRLTGRRTDSDEAIGLRLACAPAELKAGNRFDYQVVNRELEQAIDDVLAIIRAERLRTARRRPVDG